MRKEGGGEGGGRIGGKRKVREQWERGKWNAGGGAWYCGAKSRWEVHTFLLVTLCSACFV